MGDIVQNVLDGFRGMKVDELCQGGRYDQLGKRFGIKKRMGVKEALEMMM